ncbi:kinase A anchor protein [Xylariaceae sp. FL0255]|nr:kinase A anchor protein [Xylariaceae sp. FL0255]
MPPRPAPTHFLCIPLVTGTSRPQVSASLAAFKADVTSPDSFGVPEQAVRPLGTLHLTLGVMSLSPNSKNEQSLDNAVALLRSLRPGRILAGIRGEVVEEEEGKKEQGKERDPSLTVTLKGLASMQPAAKASVLYAPPVDDDDANGGNVSLLTKFCEQIRATFIDAGLMEKEDRPLLLHATILNTIYIKVGGGRGGRGGGGGGKHQKRLTVDARGMLDRYADYIWMKDVPVEKLAICRMGAKAVEGGDGEGETGDAAYVVESWIDV